MKIELNLGEKSFTCVVYGNDFYELERDTQEEVVDKLVICKNALVAKYLCKNQEE